MTLFHLTQKLRRLERLARQRLMRTSRRPLSAKMADIIRRELLYGEPPTYFTPAQVRAFTLMVIRDLPEPPEEWYRRD